MESLTQSIACNKRFENSYYYRGMCAGSTKDYKQGVADFTTALELNPARTQSLIYRGIYLVSLGQQNQACKDFELAKTMGDTSAVSYLNMYCK